MLGLSSENVQNMSFTVDHSYTATERRRKQRENKNIVRNIYVCHPPMCSTSFNTDPSEAGYRTGTRKPKWNHKKEIYTTESNTLSAPTSRLLYKLMTNTDSHTIIPSGDIVYVRVNCMRIYPRGDIRTSASNALSQMCYEYRLRDRSLTPWLIFYTKTSMSR